MEAGIQGKHFVLVHGLCHGAWCWYKLIPLLKKAGHRVTALDMAASGINMKAIEEVHTFEQYTEPLLDFMGSLPGQEKVIVVGHSLGGLNLALAMEKFPHKISAAVFLTAYVPDTINPPSFVVDKLVKAIPEGGWLDTVFTTYGCQEDPSTAALLGTQFSRILYSHSPEEDFELLQALRRPGSFFLGDLSKAKKFTEEAYGSVRRIFVISKEDQGILEAYARWMIENSGVQEVKEVEGADHMTMLSQPQRLCDCLVEVANM